MHRFLIFFLILATGCGDPQDPLAEAEAALSSSHPVDGDRETKADAERDDEAPPVVVGDKVLRYQSLLDGRLRLLIPEEFAEMDEQMAKFKYPDERRPPLVYTDESGAVNIAINPTKDRLEQRDLGALRGLMIQLVQNAHPSAIWFHRKIIEINGRDWLVLETQTPALDTEIRNIVSMTSLDGHLLLVAFNVTLELEAQWLEIGRATIQSLRIVD